VLPLPPLFHPFPATKSNAKPVVQRPRTIAAVTQAPKRKPTTEQMAMRMGMTTARTRVRRMRRTRTRARTRTMARMNAGMNKRLPTRSQKAPSVIDNRPICLQSLSIIDHLSVNSDSLDDPDAQSFEDLNNDTENPNPSGPDAKIGAADSDSFVLPPKHRPLNPPSHNLINNHLDCKVELSLQIKQATWYLSAVREAVVEKSFQYSHVMQGTHSKGIRTRS
jgi:hypothetical protein